MEFHSFEKDYFGGLFDKNIWKKMKFDLGAHKTACLQTIMQAPWPTISPFGIDSILDCPTGIPVNLTVEYWFAKNNVSTHPNGQDVLEQKHIISL